MRTPFEQAVFDSGYAFTNREYFIATEFFERGIKSVSPPKPHKTMLTVTQKANKDLKELAHALGVYNTGVVLFDTLPNTSINLTVDGIEITCFGDPREVAKILADQLQVVFTRKRVTDRSYSWVTEYSNAPIVLVMVEFMDEDLTGTLVNLVP